MASLHDASRDLVAEVCLCRKPKKRGRSFCLDCYLRLPVNIQRALWRRCGDGYEEAYVAAKEWLLA